MMRLQLHSAEGVAPNKQVVYESTVTFQSHSIPGVRFTVLRLSFARRLELARKVLELSRRLEFRAAGENVEDNIESNILSCEIDELYLRWGLVAVQGLTIDGVAATPELIAEKASEDLAREIVSAIKGQCGLSEAERKN